MRKQTRKILSLLLTVCLIFTMLPGMSMTAFAAGSGIVVSGGSGGGGGGGDGAYQTIYGGEPSRVFGGAGGQGGLGTSGSGNAGGGGGANLINGTNNAARTGGNASGTTPGAAGAAVESGETAGDAGSANSGDDGGAGGNGASATHSSSDTAADNIYVYGGNGGRGGQGGTAGGFDGGNGGNGGEAVLTLTQNMTASGGVYVQSGSGGNGARGSAGSGVSGAGGAGGDASLNTSYALSADAVNVTSGGNGQSDGWGSQNLGTGGDAGFFVSSLAAREIYLIKNPGGNFAFNAGTLDVTGGDTTLYLHSTTAGTSGTAMHGDGVYIGTARLGNGQLQIASLFGIPGTAFIGNLQLEGNGTFDDINNPVTVSKLTFDGGTLNNGNWSGLIEHTYTTTTDITLAAGGVTVNLGTGENKTLARVLTGTGGLTKTGAGTLTLTSANTYTGTTTVSAGTLILGAGSATAGTITVSGTGSVTNNTGSNITVNGQTLANGATYPTPTTYTLTVSAGTGGTVSGTANGQYASGAAINVTAAANSGYTFSGWTTSGITVSNTAAVSFSMPANAVTLTANFTSTSGGGGGGGGGSSTTTNPTIPAAGGAISVSYTQSGGAVTLSLPDSKVNEIIGKSNGTAAIDLSGVKNATSAVLPTAALKKLADAGLNTELKMPQGTIKLDADAAASVAAQAGSSNITVSLNEVAHSTLTPAQQNAIGAGDMVIDITIKSGSTVISNFDGAITVAVPYTGALPVAVWYLNSAGKLEKLDCTYDAKTGTVTFTTNHLSLYVVGKDNEAAAAWQNPFTDVAENAWYYGDVEYVYTNGLMSGTSVSPMMFSPNTPLTRGMIVTILYRAEGSPEVEPIYAAHMMDVKQGAWYEDAIGWAVKNGIISGYGEGFYGPDDNITREQLATMLYRYIQYKGGGFEGARMFLLDYADRDDIADWAYEAACYCTVNGIIGGKPGNLFDPKGNATRAEAAAMLHRLLGAEAK